MAVRPDLGGLPAGGVSALLLLVLFGSLCDVGVVDQPAEQRGNLGPDVQLLLVVGGGGDIRRHVQLHHQEGVEADEEEDLKQGQVPVVEVAPLAASVCAPQEGTVFFMVAMSWEKKEQQGHINVLRGRRRLQKALVQLSRSSRSQTIR